MNSSIQGMSVEERREVVNELWKQNPEEATRVVHSWSRNDILKILCVEMGKERKYTTLTKSKLIHNLFNLLSGRTKTNSKRKLNSDSVHCDNSACRAVLGLEDEFCKRCSCCVCHKYDDNKDPSLWLTCASDPRIQGEGCGFSCHLECAFKHEMSGIGTDNDRGRLDGRFYCLSCGKDNDLLGCWRKQMKVAKETRRVDILCHRVYLGQKLLRGTIKYQTLLGFMDKAMKKLEVDAGPLQGLPLQMARGIVNRLSSGPFVQSLCSSALDCLDKMLSDSASNQGSRDHVNVRVEEVRSRTVTVCLDSEESCSENGITGFRLFCCKSMDETYPTEATCVVYLPDLRSTITGLDPATNFSLKAVAFNAKGDVGTSELQFSTLGEDETSNPKITERSQSQSPLTISSSLSNPSSVEDESNNGEGIKIVKACNAGEVEVSDLVAGGLSESQLYARDKRVQTEGDLPVTPCKTNTQGKKKRIKRSKSDIETGVMRTEEHENGSTTIKEKEKTNNEIYDANGVPDKDLGHIMQIIRCLEQKGHIEKSFREKFLTWYSLRATHREIRVVKLFIDTFTEDLASLGEQLVDTFSECIISKTVTVVVPNGICLKLWH